MNFFKRAIISMKRNLGKTCILLLTIFILGNIISGAISISQAVQNTEKSLRSKIPAIATVEADYEAMDEHETETGEWPEIKSISPETFKEIGGLPYVKNFDYSASESLYSREMQLYNNPENEDEYYASSGIEGLEDIAVKGVQDPEILDIKENIIQLNSGRIFTDEEINNLSLVALVSKNFAETNNLHIGSTFTLENIIFNEDAWEKMYGSEFNIDENIFASQSYDLEVIGFFEQVNKASTGEDWLDHDIDSQIENRIYTPNLFAETVQRFYLEQSMELYAEDDDFAFEYDDSIYYENVFTLHDPLELDSFKEAASAILPEYYTITDLSNLYSSMTAPMESMQWLATIVLWVAVGATLLILSLLITLFLRDRKHEIGIYLALGEKKSKVISQVVVEVLTIAVLAITLSLFSGSMLSSNISETMLRNDIVAQQENDEMYVDYGPLTWMGYTSNLSTDEMIDSYDVSLNATTILIFYGVGIGTILVSAIVPIVYIVRLNPKKIMM